MLYQLFKILKCLNFLNFFMKQTYAQMEKLEEIIKIHKNYKTVLIPLTKYYFFFYFKIFIIVSLLYFAFFSVIKILSIAIFIYDNFIIKSRNLKSGSWFSGSGPNSNQNPYQNSPNNDGYYSDCEEEKEGSKSDCTRGPLPFRELTINSSERELSGVRI